MEYCQSDGLSACPGNAALWHLPPLHVSDHVRQPWREDVKKRGNRKDSPAFSPPFGVKLRFAALKRPISSLNVCFSSRTGVMPSSALPRPVRRPSLRGQQQQQQRSPPVAQVLLRLRFSPPNCFLFAQSYRTRCHLAWFVSFSSSSSLEASSILSS